MKRPKRKDYPNGVYGDISYNKQLNKYCSFLENRLKEQQKQHLIDMMKDDEKLGLYDYVGECKGNNGNGCFMDSCGHNCGCFKKQIMYSEEDLIAFAKFAKSYSTPHDVEKAFEQYKKKQIMYNFTVTFIKDKQIRQEII